MLGNKKQEIVTFKADPALLEAMRGVPNRSEFIREAIQAALHGHCPLCGGSGVLTPEQWRHWREFEKGHGVEECGKCHAVHLVCESSGAHGAQVRTHCSEHTHARTEGEQ